MPWSPCKHKTLSDHTVGRDAGDSLLWRCSFCKRVGSWQDGWAYWGNIECRICWTADIQTVHCGEPPCKEAFRKKHKGVPALRRHPRIC